MGKKADAKKSNSQNKVNMGSKRVSAARGGSNPLKRIIFSKWTLFLLLVVAILAIILWQWPNIVHTANNLAKGVYGLLGWGFILILLAVIIFLAIAFRGHLATFARRYKLHLWHVFVGATALFFAAWGVLALFSLGGEVGLAITSDVLAVGLMRVIGLILLGIVFIAPGASFRAIRAICRFFARLFRPSPSKPSSTGTQVSPYMPKRVPVVTQPATTMSATPKPHAGGVITGAPPAEKKSWFPPFGKSTQFSEDAVATPPRDTPAYHEVFPVSAPAPKEPARTEMPKSESSPITPPKPVSAYPVYKEAFKISNPTKEPVRTEMPIIENPTPRAVDKQVAQDIWRKYGEAGSPSVVDGWKMPPLDILDKAKEMEYSEADNAQRAQIIEEALASYGVSGKVIQINIGPTVTQFGIEPGWDIKTKRVAEKDNDGNTVFREEEVARTRVKVERITSLTNDLALALAAPTIRIEAPVPGKSIVGVEVPNRVYSTVSLRSVIETNAFQKILSKSRLAMALGKGAGGEAVSDDLAKMPHLLIAGATGSGKTVCLNAVICCLLMNNSPFDTKFVLIDPKRVELTPFNSLPHLAAPVIVDTDKALAAMRWLNAEMDNRYKKLASAGARNIEGFNRDKAGAEKMPNIVLVIDELADLMMAGFDEVEHILCRLAQLARAVGIHLVVATQRPSVDVITGLIKANFPTRISFAVTSQVDSRTVLDMVGAEKLLGHGDMLFAPTDAAKPKRLQGCYVSDPEVERLVYFWNSQKKEDTPLIKMEDIIAMGAAKKDVSGEDPLMETVRKLANDHNQQISASFLQRKLNIGYPRAARLFDKFKEEMGPNGDGGAEVPADEDDES
ncbi:MAG: DNA translocase FtsK [Dehalococcoidia bacterium]|nr:DNA translocase FtsK [Dehalococcoidia bacterium]